MVGGGVGESTTIRPVSIACSLMIVSLRESN